MRQWKIGTVTAGLLLITLGVVWLGTNFWDIPIDVFITNGWPILLIILGVEVLLHQFFKKEESLKFDGFSIFLVIILGFVSLVIYGVQSTGILPAMKNAISGEKYNQELHLSEDIEGIEEFEIDIPNGDIIVTGSSTEEVKVDALVSISAENEKVAKELLEKSVTLQQIGKKLYLKVEIPNHQQIFDWDALDGTFHIEVPTNMFVTMNVKNGDVQADNLLNGGKMDLVNGDLELNNIARDMKVNNTNGSITVNEWDGELIASLTNGDIDLKTSKVSAPIDVDTVNGDVTATIPISANATITGKSESGEVTGTLAWERSGAQDDEDLEKNGTAVLESGTHKIDFSTINGDVTVNAE